MYKPNKVTDNNELVNFVEGDDIYNSALVINLKDTPYDESKYITRRKDKRLDIIANSTGISESLLSITNKITKGDKLDSVNCISKTDLDNIIAKSMK